MTIDIDRLEATLELVKPRANEFLESFYHNLFTDYPATQALFHRSDMKKQKIMLLNALAFTVNNLRTPEKLDQTLKGLGDRHIQYGALSEHYTLFGQSLLKTFEQYLGADWTPETQVAWLAAYQAIADRMVKV
ncbi:MAG: globin domain-containing protein [Oculatellaceae cyanobacterium Prado106]|jgi:hemoglobin-like flavoprotein|nr:globin domain-containing protein [Oculatellaceae cyanobacterium Prado106]